MLNTLAPLRNSELAVVLLNTELATERIHPLAFLNPADLHLLKSVEEPNAWSTKSSQGAGLSPYIND